MIIQRQSTTCNNRFSILNRMLVSVSLYLNRSWIPAKSARRLIWIRAFVRTLVELRSFSYSARCLQRSLAKCEKHMERLIPDFLAVISISTVSPPGPQEKTLCPKASLIRLRRNGISNVSGTTGKIHRREEIPSRQSPRSWKTTISIPSPSSFCTCGEKCIANICRWKKARRDGPVEQ